MLWGVILTSAISKIGVFIYWFFLTTRITECSSHERFILGLPDPLEACVITWQR